MADFLLKGNLRTREGTVSPFDVQRFEKVPVRIALALADESRLEVRFRVDRTGPSWQWAGVLETGNFRLAGRAVEVVTPDAIR